MKSVLHVRLDAPCFSSQGIETAFRNNGFIYNSFRWQEIRFNDGLQSMREQLIKKARECASDLIFLHIQNSEIIDVETVRQLSEIGFVVNYTFDTREDISWYKELAPHIGLTVFGSLNEVDECYKAGISNVEHLHSSCDVELYRPIALHEEVRSKYPEIVFIGNRTDNTNLNFPLSKQRTKMVEFLEETYGSRFKAFGIGWKDGRIINPQEEVMIYNSCKIAITHNQFYREGYCSDRQWRSTACNVFTAMNEYSGGGKDFPSGLFWKNFNDLKLICDDILANEYYRQKVAIKNHQRFLSHHTWAHRINELKTLCLKHGYMDSVFKRHQQPKETTAILVGPLESEPIKCRHEHLVNGIVPPMYDESYDGKICDCGRIKFYKEDCNCPGSPGWQIKTKPNE